jgi:Na+-transporting NADH:ubiquinone oxidoreductase subunit C
MKKRIFPVIYMFLITFVFTSMVSAVKVLQDERIRMNEKVKLERVILKVLKIAVEKKASNQEIINTFENQIKETDIDGKRIFVGYEKDRETIRGYAFPVSGPGFWGPIYGMAAVERSGTRLIGLAFYRHSETPGLGGRITGDWFQKQFGGLKLTGDNKSNNIFTLKPEGTAKGPSELDAITGATMTSRGVEKFLNQELINFVVNTRDKLINSRKKMDLSQRTGSDKLK